MVAWVSVMVYHYLSWLCLACSVNSPCPTNPCFACSLDLAGAVVLDVHGLLRLVEACMQLDMSTIAAVQLRTQRLLIVPMLVGGEWPHCCAMGCVECQITLLRWLCQLLQRVLVGGQQRLTASDIGVLAPPGNQRAACLHYRFWPSYVACLQAMLGRAGAALGDHA
jgi:hypothetical protein